jgi:signal transduction histidine kinase
VPEGALGLHSADAQARSEIRAGSRNGSEPEVLVAMSVEADPPQGREPARGLPLDAGPVRPADDLETRQRADDRRQAWSDASIETAATLLGGYEEHPLTALAARVRAVADADVVTLLRIGGDASFFTAEAAAGRQNPLSTGDRVPVAGSVAGGVLEAVQPRLLPETASGPRDAHDPGGPLMAVPMRSGDRAVGVVLVGRLPGRPPFLDADLEQCATFVDHATVAIELAEARLDRERLALLQERARIARDLHDTVIQLLFAAGLELRALPRPGTDADGVQHAAGLVDAAIAQIRIAVLALSPGAVDSLRHRVLEVIGELGGSHAAPPQLSFDGPVDLVARGSLADDVVAVVRESLANVAKHAAAERVEVAVRAVDGALEVEVRDDGVGLPDQPSRSGLANLADRAARRRGTFDASSTSPGTRVLWRVPYDDEAPA